MVTWLQLDDDGTADDVLASQCRSIDKSTYTEQAGFTAAGADKACAGSGESLARRTPPRWRPSRVVQS